LLWATLAAAQENPSTTANPAADPSAAAPAQPQTVTVTAPASGYRSSIDRKSYSIANDLQKGSGALADVLRKVPSVQVGSEGDVSIRGDTDVTILVDGKPSALFSGPGRAQAIQSLPADQYDRVEVMTNPSAAQTAEGSGGVINLISKPTAKGAAPTTSGTLNASLGSGDRLNLGVSGAYSNQGLSLSGSASFRRGAFNRDIGTRYGLADPTTGAIVQADGLQHQKEREDTLTLNSALGYDLDPRDHLDASLTLVNDREVQNQVASYRTGGGGGVPALDYTAPGFTHGAYTTASGSLGFTRTLPGEDHSLSIKLSGSDGRIYGQDRATYSYRTPVQPNFYQDLVQTAGFPQLDLKIDYKTPLSNKAKLALGYEGKFDWQSEGNSGVQGSSATLATVNPALTQKFRFNQEVQAVYATYEEAFGKLTAQLGLRLENATLETNLVSGSQKGRQAYFDAYPSLHLAYELDDTSQIKFSYGRRVHRPEENQLDPFRIESTPTLYSAGNPDLRPATTQSYELGYEYRHRATNLQATLYYRDNINLHTMVTDDIGGGVLLSTWQNLGSRRDAGLELVANRDLSKTLTLSASADLMHSQVDVANLGLAGRSAFIASAQTTLNWQVGPKDFLQLGTQASGRRLTAQGYYGGAIFEDFGWRHRFDSRLASLVTVQDPFGLSRRTVAIDTPTLVDVQKRKFNYTAIFIGFTYALGGASKRPADNFDFGAQHPGGQ
jgi:outer membrane receptor for ferrienterochelin and colicin